MATQAQLDTILAFVDKTDAGPDLAITATLLDDHLALVLTDVPRRFSKAAELRVFTDEAYLDALIALIDAVTLARARQAVVYDRKPLPR